MFTLADDISVLDGGCIHILQQQSIPLFFPSRHTHTHITIYNCLVFALSSTILHTPYTRFLTRHITLQIGSSRDKGSTCFQQLYLHLHSSYTSILNLPSSRTPDQTRDHQLLWHIKVERAALKRNVAIILLYSRL